MTTTKVVLKRSEIAGLFSVIEQLNGRHRDILDKDGSFKGMIVDPFKLSGDASDAAAKTGEVLATIVDYQDRVKKRRLKQAQGGDATDEEKQEKLIELQEVFDQMDEEQIEVEIYTAKREGFNFEENKIPPALQRRLAPMFEGWKRASEGNGPKSKFDVEDEPKE